MTKLTKHIKVEMLEDGLALLTFDRADSAANIFDRATLRELDAHVKAIAAETSVKGVIFYSAKKSIFIAGADIKELSTVPKEELIGIVKLGQNVFTSISNLKVPTVAAIHGAALGGGCELCLACDGRIASDGKATKIGLPETMLGILPVWGGATRLPRLIGLPKALDIILGGKRLAPKPAKKCGLIDDLVPQEYLLKAAIRAVKKNTWTRKSHTLVNNALAVKLITRKVAPDLEKKTRGNYPAIPKALEVVTAGVGVSLEESLKLEQDAIAVLVDTLTCHNLMRVFFLQERAKKLSFGKSKNASTKPKSVDGVAVVGAGIMGAGIAQWCSARGHRVTLCDIGAEQISKGMASIAKVYHQATKRHIFDKVTARQGLDRITPCTTLVPLGRVDVVVEAAVEQMEIKKKIFKNLAERSRPDTILATNTSALSISELAKGVPNPERVVGIHFFNPVHRMQLVEIVVGAQTDEEVVARVLRFVQKLGKLPVVVKDSPGFLVNRILMPYLIEAGHLFEAGASIRAIDEAMMNFGMPMGPLRLIDEVGVDVSHHVATHLSQAYSDRLDVPKALEGMMKAKLLGRKLGSGFYIYSGKNEPMVNSKMQAYVKESKAVHFTPQDLQERMSLLMVNEAARCLEEKLVEAPEDVDFGMIMGTGFAPFRGGPLRYADRVGVSNIVMAMNELVQDEHVRFKPCMLLETMAKAGKSFYEKG